MSFGLHLGLLAILLVPYAASADAACTNFALAAEQEIGGGPLTLAALLPACAPAAVVSGAERIALGAAPRAGVVRILQRKAILRAMEKSGLAAGAFRIPAEVVVRRSGRRVSREEVLSVVREALAKQGIACAEALRAEAIQFEANVQLPEESARLVVTQIEIDPALGRVRFRLHEQEASSVPPVFVTAALGDPLLGELRRKMETSGSGGGRVRRQSAGPVLIRSGQVARIRMHSRDLEILVDVTPLESGRLGETIRVRLPDTGKILRAQVLSGGALEASF